VVFFPVAVSFFIDFADEFIDFFDDFFLDASPPEGEIFLDKTVMMLSIFQVVMSVGKSRSSAEKRFFGGSYPLARLSRLQMTLSHISSI
jgi:hypothetical protein